MVLVARYLFGGEMIGVGVLMLANAIIFSDSVHLPPQHRSLRQPNGLVSASLLTRVFITTAIATFRPLFLDIQLHRRPRIFYVIAFYRSWERPDIILRQRPAYRGRENDLQIVLYSVLRNHLILNYTWLTPSRRSTSPRS